MIISYYMQLLPPGLLVAAVTNLQFPCFLHPGCRCAVHPRCAHRCRIWWRADDVEPAVGGRMLESSSPPPAVRAIVIGVAATNDGEAALSAISALQVPQRLTATQPVATHTHSALGHS